MNIKPIETIYNGYKFRSRLEARWAVFFDEMNIKYEYELEGFEMQIPKDEIEIVGCNKLFYLPDFYIQELDIFVEIKPSIDKIDESDIFKIVTFLTWFDKNLLLIIGTPTNQKMYILNRNTMFPISYFHECETINPNMINSTFQEKLLRILLYTHECVEFGTNIFNGKLQLNIANHRTVIDNMKYDIALTSAKQARFEFDNKK
jgi:hypothetical protein